MMHCQFSGRVGCTNNCWCTGVWWPSFCQRLHYTIKKKKKIIQHYEPVLVNSESGQPKYEGRLVTPRGWSFVGIVSWVVSAKDWQEDWTQRHPPQIPVVLKGVNRFQKNYFPININMFHSSRGKYCIYKFSSASVTHLCLGQRYAQLIIVLSSRCCYWLITIEVFKEIVVALTEADKWLLWHVASVLTCNLME